MAEESSTRPHSRPSAARQPSRSRVSRPSSIRGKTPAEALALSGEELASLHSVRFPQ